MVPFHPLLGWRTSVALQMLHDYNSHNPWLRLMCAGGSVGGAQVPHPCSIFQVTQKATFPRLSSASERLMQMVPPLQQVSCSLMQIIFPCPSQHRRAVCRPEREANFCSSHTRQRFLESSRKSAFTPQLSVLPSLHSRGFGALRERNRQRHV